SIFVWLALAFFSHHRLLITLGSLVGTALGLLASHQMYSTVAFLAFYMAFDKQYLRTYITAAVVPAFSTFLIGGLSLVLEILLRWFPATSVWPIRLIRPGAAPIENTPLVQSSIVVSSRRTSPIHVVIALTLYCFLCGVTAMFPGLVLLLFWYT